jgi:hypothetical protein
MWVMLPSLQPLVEALLPAFTQPSFATHSQLVLAWIMCLGRHSLFTVAKHTQPQQLHDHSQRHGLDTYFNFFERSAWQPSLLQRCLAQFLFLTFKLTGTVTLLIDDTLIHKRGRCVWGRGWWRDPVASTQKRVATASGHNWVVLAVALCLPFTGIPILAVPLLARLHLPGKGQPSCAALARQMLQEVLGWFPDYHFILVGDGGYANVSLLKDLPAPVQFVGRLRGDAALYDPKVPRAPKGKRGPKAKKGPRLPSPAEAATKADRKRVDHGAWLWQMVEVTLYGCTQTLQALSYVAVWPRVLGLRPVQIVVVRDPAGKLEDMYLFTTDLEASVVWVIQQYGLRWSEEVLFRASKQEMDIEAPQHWSEESVAKVAPWVWCLQSVVMVWYLTAGRDLPEAEELRQVMGEWDSEWSLRHMLQVLRRAVLNATINPNSGSLDQLNEMIQTLKNWAHLAA